MRTNIEYLDIFHQPIKRTFEARSKEFARLVNDMNNSNLIKRPEWLGEFAYLCQAGYVSARVASYFLADKVQPHHRNVLSSFLNFLKDYEAIKDYTDIVTHSLNYLALWSHVNSVAVENTFLFPLEELAFSDPLSVDFASEKRDYELF